MDRDAFHAKVEARARRYLSEGLPLRAEALRTALTTFYRDGAALDEALAAGRDRLQVEPA